MGVTRSKFAEPILKEHEFETFSIGAGDVRGGRTGNGGAVRGPGDAGATW
jgi:hypothetical protein